MIYLNAAGHGLPAKQVRDRMRAYLDREDEIGPGRAEAEASEEVAACRDKAARIIDADPADVMLQGTTTIGWNAAVLSLPLAGRRVLAAPGEWISDVAVLARMGARIEVMPTDGSGLLDVDAIAGRIDDDLAAICAPMVCSLTGEQYPLVQLGALPRPDDCLFIVDAAQALGQFPVSVRDLRADILASTTRKWLRGPRDTALVYVAPRVFELMRPNPAPRIAGIHGQGAQVIDKKGIDRFNPGAVFAPQRLGLGTALDLYLSDPSSHMAAPALLASRLREGVLALGWRLACPEGAPPSAITTITHSPDRISAAAEALRGAGFSFVTPNPDCEPLRQIDGSRHAFLRLSPHAYNTEAEIDHALANIGRA